MSRDQGTVDAIEGEVARIELREGGVVTLPARLLPRGVREGDGVTLALEADPEGTLRMRSEVLKKRAKLAADDDGGDFGL